MYDQDLDAPRGGNGFEDFPFISLFKSVRSTIPMGKIRHRRLPIRAPIHWVARVRAAGAGPPRLTSENRQRRSAGGDYMPGMQMTDELLDRDACYKVFQTHDSRFDGRIFVGVTSTGIYCRPICPARTPMFKNCRFFASVAAAQEAGFRPCLRCRPETSPDLAFWRGTSNTVSRALALIEAGGLDEADVEGLANRLGVGARQLRRLFRQYVGASPIAVAQT